MKKLLFYYFIFIFADTSISAGEIDGGLNYLNNLRKNAGLITFKSNDKLNTTAKITWNISESITIHPI